MANFNVTDTIHFMNVDLEVRSRSPLEPLANGFSKAVTVLYVGRVGKLYGAYFELADWYEEDADGLMGRFVALVRRLSPGVRKLWNDAQSRDFNVGIQSAPEPRYHELRLHAETLAAVARVRGSVVITTYAPIGGAPPVVTKRARTRRPSPRD